MRGRSPIRESLVGDLPQRAGASRCRQRNGSRPKRSTSNVGCPTSCTVGCTLVCPWFRTVRSEHRPFQFGAELRSHLSTTASAVWGPAPWTKRGTRAASARCSRWATPGRFPPFAHRASVYRGPAPWTKRGTRRRWGRDRNAAEPECSRPGRATRRRPGRERFPRAVHGRDPPDEYSGGGQAVGNAGPGRRQAAPRADERRPVPPDREHRPHSVRQVRRCLRWR